MNTETRSYFVGNSDNILEALKQGNLSWKYLRLDFKKTYIKIGKVGVC